MKIALAQLDPIVGDFEGNLRKIEGAYERACKAGARLLVTPELSICGYPLNDLLDRPEIFEGTSRALEKLKKFTLGKECALAVGCVAPSQVAEGKSASNLAVILENGQEVFRQAKTLLPTYDVFDEARYFQPAAESNLWNGTSVPVGVAICEDLWARDEVLGRKLYGKDPIHFFKEKGAKVLISLSASPYGLGKRERRERIHGESAKELGVPLIYVNQVGATDEILFDGGSFVADASGRPVGRLPLFKTGFGVVELIEGQSPRWLEDDGREDEPPSEVEGLARGLVVGIREYFQRTGFKTAVMGLSGGIDSAVVAVLAAEALGPKNVLGVAMPSQYSSGHSLSDAEELARRLGLLFEVKPIKFFYSTLSREIGQPMGGLAPIALENLQARLRGLTLMTLANHYSALVLTTGNKSELATGYCTLYGDMCGALAPIADLYKTKVYELARYLNESRGNPIPESSLTKAPSAELRPDQKDQDSLPPYEKLDALLADYIEGYGDAGALVKKHGPWAADILRLVERNEYKRRQAAPALKVTTKAFGMGRRVPIAKSWNPLH